MNPLCDDCGRYEATVSLDENSPPILCDTCVKVALGILMAYDYDQEG